jgi:hypothetical protein
MEDQPSLRQQNSRILQSRKQTCSEVHGKVHEDGMLESSLLTFDNGVERGSLPMWSNDCKRLIHT